MSHVNIAVVLFQENILADLVSADLSAISPSHTVTLSPVNKGIVQTELENKLFKLDLYLLAGILVVVLGWQNA